MKSTELQALRRLLFFNVPEAALHIGGGVSERAWKHWEAGARDVPEDVAANIRALASWRDHAIEAMRKAISAQIRKRGKPADIVLVWYTSADAWATLPDREIGLWRPQCSALAQIVAEFDCARLVAFDGPAFARWLAGRLDSESMRAAWAGETA